MGARGRKSGAELATIGPAGVAIQRRPEPPAHLGDEAAERWRAIVSTLPADWFSPGSLPLLEALCALAVSQRRTAEALEKLEAGDGEFDEDQWRRFQRQLGEMSSRISTLATRLRLTPQSRYMPRGAARAAGRHPGAAALWGGDGTPVWARSDEPKPPWEEEE